MLCRSGKPIIIKCLQVKIYVDGNEIWIEVPDTIKQFIANASSKLQRTLCQYAYDSKGELVTNLDDFIMRTDTNRALHLDSICPPRPSFNMSSSVSAIATKEPNVINNRCSVYPAYAHHFCLKVYDVFCRDPSTEAKQFCEKFQEIMEGPSEALFRPDERTYASFVVS